MSAIEDLLKLLDKVPGWKRMAQSPARLDALEQRVAALEGRAAGGMLDPCPLCGAALKRVAVKPDPVFGAMGLQRHEFACTGCDHRETRQIDPAKSR